MCGYGSNILRLVCTLCGSCVFAYIGVVEWVMLCMAKLYELS
jgi:hypothetical protein